MKIAVITMLVFGALSAMAASPSPGGEPGEAFYASPSAAAVRAAAPSAVADALSPSTGEPGVAFYAPGTAARGGGKELASNGRSGGTPLPAGGEPGEAYLSAGRAQTLGR